VASVKWPDLTHVELVFVQAYIVAMKAAILGVLLSMVLTSAAQDSRPSKNVRVPDAATP
jgi:hypothetical protein